MAAQGDSQKYCVTGTGGPLKVTLVWHDVPAALSAATQLVNDLDLTVYANSLNGYSVLGNGVSDHLNNVEQVRWQACSASMEGRWCVCFAMQVQMKVHLSMFLYPLQRHWHCLFSRATSHKRDPVCACLCAFVHDQLGVDFAA